MHSGSWVHSPSGQNAMIDLRRLGHFAFAPAGRTRAAALPSRSAMNSRRFNYGGSPQS